jgi:hypothetical protein
MKKKVIDLEIIDDMIQSGVSQIALVDVPAIEKYWMAFRKEEFIEPNAGESEEEFLGRCIPAMLDEGKEQDQAVAMCYSMYQNMSYDTGALPVYTDEIPDKEEEFADSYLDYPEKAVLNARRALDWAEKNGWGDCGTPIGKQRANQLANRQRISEDTIARMAAFERHRQNSKTPYEEGCGKLMWDAWGGSEGIEWAARKLREIRGEEFEIQGIILPRGEKVVLQAEDQNYDRGLVVELMEDGGYNVEYWYDSPDNIEPVEVQVDGEKITDAGSLIYLGYHPEFQEFAPIQRIPKEERGREGSDKNKPGDTKTSRGGIEVSQEVEKTLKDKIEEHNKKNPQDSQKADLGMLKAVWRRGAGAYSVGTPGRRGMTRSQWAMGRVNAFLKILSGSAPSDKDYKQDNDLLPKGHPKHSEQQMSKFLFASEDQQILVGPVAVPDMEIVRKDKKTKEIYYVRFSKEVVQRMAEKFMKELRNDQTNIDHNPEDKAGSYIMETWVVENEQDKANSVYNLDVPIGTWVVKMRVTDPETWKMVKNGELRGFSLEGNFLDREDWEAYQKDREIYNKVMNILKSC